MSHQLIKKKIIIAKFSITVRNLVFARAQNWTSVVMKRQEQTETIVVGIGLQGHQYSADSQ